MLFTVRRDTACQAGMARSFRIGGRLSRWEGRGVGTAELNETKPKTPRNVPFSLGRKFAGGGNQKPSVRTAQRKGTQLGIVREPTRDEPRDEGPGNADAK